MWFDNEMADASPFSEVKILQLTNQAALAWSGNMMGSMRAAAVRKVAPEMMSQKYTCHPEKGQCITVEAFYNQFGAMPQPNAIFAKRDECKCEFTPQEDDDDETGDDETPENAQDEIIQLVNNIVKGKDNWEKYGLIGKSERAFQDYAEQMSRATMKPATRLTTRRFFENMAIIAEVKELPWLNAATFQAWMQEYLDAFSFLSSVAETASIGTSDLTSLNAVLEYVFKTHLPAVTRLRAILSKLIPVTVQADLFKYYDDAAMAAGEVYESHAQLMVMMETSFTSFRKPKESKSVAAWLASKGQKGASITAGYAFLVARLMLLVSANYYYMSMGSDTLVKYDPVWRNVIKKEMERVGLMNYTFIANATMAYDNWFAPPSFNFWGEVTTEPGAAFVWARDFKIYSTQWMVWGINKMAEISMFPMTAVFGVPDAVAWAAYTYINLHFMLWSKRTAWEMIQEGYATTVGKWWNLASMRRKIVKPVRGYVCSPRKVCVPKYIGSPRDETGETDTLKACLDTCVSP